MPAVEQLNKGDINSILPFMLICVGLFFVMQSTYFFAPALVVFRACTPLESMRLSLLGFWRNIRALILMYTLTVLLASLVLLPFILMNWVPQLQAAMPTFMLLILFFFVLPISFHASFTSYMDIYENRIGR